MIQKRLLTIIEKNTEKTNSLYLRTLLKEALQDYVLQFVYNHKLYKSLLFTGGTCLRKVYNLPRLSEYLDFDFTKSFDIEKFAELVKQYFIEEFQYKQVETKITGKGNTVFLKFPVLQELGLVSSPADASVLFVRCDFSDEKFGIFGADVHMIATEEFTFYVRSYDLPTLFANKITAFVSREFFKGSEQSMPFKGRDVFDLVWFFEQSAKTGYRLQPIWERIYKQLQVKNKEEVLDAIEKKLKIIDKESVQKDLVPFIASRKELQNFVDNYSALMETTLQSFSQFVLAL